MPKFDKGEFIAPVRTSTPGVELNVSFSDALSPKGDMDHLLIQVGKEGSYTVAHLDRNQAERLRWAISEALVHWYAK